jgi:hypothetical protein
MIKSGLPTTPKKNLFLTGNRTPNGGGILFFWSNTTLPTLDASDRAIGFQGTAPKYWNGTSWAAFTSGEGGYTTWDELYANDKTLTLNSGTLTLSLTDTSSNGLTLTAAASATGSCLQFSNAGTGADVTGTSSTWSISKSGSAVFTSITGCNSLTAASNLTLNANGAGTITLGNVSTGGITLARAVSCSASLSVATTLSVGQSVSVTGNIGVTDTSNTSSALQVVNNTLTTYGNATNSGMVTLSSTSLTTGTLLHLSAKESAMAGGYYLKCWGQDAGAAVFTIGENGVVTIAGPTGGGSTAFVLTAGDVSIGDGSITLVDGDNAASLSVTNNTATTVGAGADTGVSVLTSSSLTTGTLLHLSLTSGALTTGSYLRCYDQASSSTVFSIGAYGATVISTTGDVYGLSVTVNKASASQGVVKFTNASTTSGKPVLELVQSDVNQPYISFSGANIVTSASAGTNGSLPAQVAGYLLVNIDGINRKIPYYA